MANFPAANHEASEAGKCFATARYTACVFHLMRVMEVGVQEFGAVLSVAGEVEFEANILLFDVGRRLL